MDSVVRKYSRVGKMCFFSHQLSEGLASWLFWPSLLAWAGPLRSPGRPHSGNCRIQFFFNKCLCTLLWNNSMSLTFTLVNLRSLYFLSHDHNLKTQKSLKLNPGLQKGSVLSQPRWKFKRCFLAVLIPIGQLCLSWFSFVFFNSTGFRF